MPFAPNSVELSNRLRRAFGVRGSLSVSVDEVAAPVVQLFDASGAPFRTSGYRWWMQSSQTAPAGQIPMISVVAERPGSIVIDEVHISGPSLVHDYAIAWGTDVYFVPNGGQSSELDNFTPVAPANVPVRLLVATVNSPYAGAEPFYRSQSQSGDPLIVKIDQPITGQLDNNVISSLRILNQTVASTLVVAVTGRYWPDLQ